MCVAPWVRAARVSSRYRASRAAAGTPVVGLVPRQRSVWCSIASVFASFLTSLASRAASLRKPWSTVIATRRGPRFSARRQRAASHIMATESGPPDTAKIIAGAVRQSANKFLASCAEIGE